MTKINNAASQLMYPHLYPCYLHRVETSDFRQFIRDALAERRLKNPDYSLRAFAQLLEMSPQKLNSILNRQAGLSLRAATALAEKLKLSEPDKRLFLTLVESQHSRSLVVRGMAKKKLKEMQSFDSDLKNLEESEFEEISEWHLIAIYILLDLKDFNPDSQWIAKKLNITPTEAEEACAKLFRLKFITKSENGDWVRTAKKLSFFPEAKSDSIRKYRKSLIDIAKKTVDSDNLETKCFNEIVIPILKSDMEVFKTEFSNFQKRIFSLIANRTQPSDRVYAVMMSAFPIDQE